MFRMNIGAYILFLFIISSHCYQMNVGSTGILFPYTLGALAYIKHVIKPANYTLTGISGGAWCSVLYHFEPNIDNPSMLWSILVGDQDTKINLLSRKSMQGLQETAAANFKARYKTANVTDIPISIVTTKISRGFKNTKISKFDDIDDLINFCLCSSYIPFISGNGPYMKYKGNLYIDGEVKRDKCIGNCINSKIWGRKYNLKQRIFLDLHSVESLFEDGWNDATKYAASYLFK